MSELQRVLEPEVMDTREEAVDYDAMDHSHVNRVFVEDLMAAGADGALRASDLHILDVGTGTVQIPIELCRKLPQARITAIDLAEEMLKVGRNNVTAAGLEDRIRIERIDAKLLPYEDGSFDVVMSNSIVHHIPEPLLVLREMVRVLVAGGQLFARDLIRPHDTAELQALVETYASDENEHQQSMFRESLHAALTVAEVRQLLINVGLPPEWCRQTSDRHWTISGQLTLK